jgi:flagellar basal body P-ring formation protein FlgA
MTGAGNDLPPGNPVLPPPCRPETLNMLPLLAPALLLAASPGATAFQSTETLDLIVAQFTGRPVGALGGARAPVDARLKLAACAAPQLAWRSDAHDAVVVRCMAPEWRIFVVVNAPPAPRPAPAPAAAPTPRPAPPPKVEPVIRRGDPLTLEAGAAGFSITRDGIAMGDAAPGARLMVRVDDKRPPIQAIAIEAGRARLPGGGE